MRLKDIKPNEPVHWKRWGRNAWATHGHDTDWYVVCDSDGDPILDWAPSWRNRVPSGQQAQPLPIAIEVHGATVVVDEWVRTGRNYKVGPHQEVLIYKQDDNGQEFLCLVPLSRLTSNKDYHAQIAQQEENERHQEELEHKERVIRQQKADMLIALMPATDESGERLSFDDDDDDDPMRPGVPDILDPELLSDWVQDGDFREDAVIDAMIFVMNHVNGVK